MDTLYISNPEFDISLEFMFLLVSEKDRLKVQVIKCLYRDGMSLLGAGKKIGVSRQRISQVKNEILDRTKKMKYRKPLIFEGIDSYYEYVLNERESKYKEKLYQKGYNEGKEYGYQIGRWANQKSKEIVAPEITEDTPIEQAGFTTRTKNMLMRNNIISVRELMECQPQKIAFWNGCGKISFKEIVDLRKKLGYDTEEYIQVYENL